MKGVCKLCLQESELQQSHIIPRSYFKRLKKEDGKIMVVQEGKKTITGNFDPKEPMLCRNCEQFLSKNYEHYGIRVLRDHKNFRKNSDHIVIASFQYETFYLYLISILWRASVAKQVHYNSVQGDENLDDLLRYCIAEKRVKINKLSGLRLDHFIKISVFRVVDSTGNISDEVIKVLLSNFVQRRDEAFKGIMWYFLVEGFIIFYNLSVGKDMHEIRTMKFLSQLTKGSHQKIMKAEITQSKILTDLFNSLIESARQDD
ncbi:hypothetical protein [Pantoea dispersa]|uniref:hypothetical protein n=1 Tax=Pantoea dispersa TaxID=59814 RepID=UPI00144B1017|nr:hypothetical protein [Pantoea dispersa]KAF0856679.1 hypothetical protein Y788_04820 [Pantoea dispersa 625]